MRRLLLLGYFGAGNLGDDCLLADFLTAHGERLRALSLSCDISSSGKAPLAGFSEERRLGELLGEKIDKRELLRRPLTGYDGLVVPGGSVLQDVSSLKSLLFYLEVLRRAAGQGLPLYLLHQGLGPFQHWLSRWLTPRWLRRARMLSLRDEASFNWAQAHVRKLQGGAVPQLSADPVLAGRLSADRGLLPAGLSPGQYIVAIPRPTGDLPHPGDDTPEAAALAELLRHMQQRSGLPVLLAPFHGEQDAQFCLAVRAAAPELALYAVPSAAAAFHASALLALVQNAAFVLSYRLHGLVIAASAEVPALGVAYDPKVSSFCTEMGYPCCYPAEVHEDSTLELFSEAWEGLAEIRRACSDARALALGRLRGVEQEFAELL